MVSLDCRSIMHRLHTTATTPFDMLEAFARLTQLKQVVWATNFIQTLWLFTLSDMKTFVFPQTAFGVFSALSGPLLTSNHAPSLPDVLVRLPKVFLWTWLNTLVFDLANQRHPEAVLEDTLNKPWRPLPAGKITQEQTGRLLFLAIPITLAIIHLWLGASEETVLLFVLTWMYNDLGGSDDNFIVRNLVIAVAYTLYGSGALRVACAAPRCDTNHTSLTWLVVVGLIIFTTMHVQDLKDVVGDKARNRKTAPLVVGETCTRYFLAAAITFWSIVCCVFWRLSVSHFATMSAFGAFIALRLIARRSIAADRATWKLWSMWLMSLYALPWAKFHLAG